MLGNLARQFAYLLFLIIPVAAILVVLSEWLKTGKWKPRIYVLTVSVLFGGVPGLFGIFALWPYYGHANWAPAASRAVLVSSCLTGLLVGVWLIYLDIKHPPIPPVLEG